MNQFDEALEARFGRHIPLVRDVTGKSSETLRDAIIFAVDTLEVCWLGAQQIYGAAAAPSQAFDVYDRVMRLLVGTGREELLSSQIDDDQG